MRTDAGLTVSADSARIAPVHMTPARKRNLIEERRQKAAQLAATLERRHSTRLIMLLVVSGAAAIGFLSSAVMLWMGMRYMPVRYALAGLAGYGVFLVLMNKWLGHHSRSSLLERAADIGDSLDLPGELLRGGSRVGKRAADGIFGGGRSGGGGASASFDAPGVAPQVQPLPIMASTAGDKGSSKGFSLDSLDFDDADDALPLIAVIAIVAALIACASVVWQAPQMLGELLADGAVAGTAYRGMRQMGGWTPAVMRRTFFPAAIIILIFVLLGIAGHELKPDADSIGDFFR